jgi:prepilin-type N-terminal cleavage/methylation domain-containing protein
MNKSLFKENFKGFTLIELLVVIAIIGLLSSMSVYAINVARMKARDTRRMTDLKQIQSAVELYYDDHGTYPAYIAFTDNTHCGVGGNWCVFESVLAPYLKDLPRDPLGLQTGYRYYYDSDSGDNYQTYGMMIRFENSGNFSLSGNDGGYYNTYYEIGGQPTYCSNKYTGIDSNWWGAQTTVCAGGN